MASLQLATQAMATRFELVLHGPRPTALRSAGEEAIAEIQRLDAALSVHQPGSEIAALNRDAARHPVRVSPEVFHLLQRAVLLSQVTGGAFDITVGPLLQAWGFVRGSGHLPEPAQLEQARAAIGPAQLVFHPDEYTVEFAHPSTRIDLGSIGKGYALDRATDFLREAGVTRALVHGGTSTAVALGTPEDAEAWKIAIAPPVSSGDSLELQPPRPSPSSSPAPWPAPPPLQPLAVVALHDESLSVSAVWGKGFSADGRYYGHVIDPRTGQPTQGAVLAAMIDASATVSDALSTALLLRGSELIDLLRQAKAPCRCLVATPTADPPGYQLDSLGIP
ncbi:MAG: FAD:protein FMN transferase [Limisphaerales bacterium]